MVKYRSSTLIQRNILHIQGESKVAHSAEQRFG